MAEPASDTIYLKRLLHDLPDDIPIGTSADYPFLSFSVDPSEVDKGLAGEISTQYKNIFGWGPSVLLLRARGPNVEAAGDVLGRYLKHPDCQAEIMLVKLWGEKFTDIAKCTYEDRAVVCDRRSTLIHRWSLPFWMTMLRRTRQL
jgi:hypothetical protein